MHRSLSHPEGDVLFETRRPRRRPPARPLPQRPPRPARQGAGVVAVAYSAPPPPETSAFSDFPATLLKTLRSGAEGTAIWLAVRSGFRDESRLTSLVFYARHPERGGQPIQKSEPGFKTLSQEWLNIRDRLVRPILAGGPATPSAPPGSFKLVPVESPGGERIRNKKDPKAADLVRVPHWRQGTRPLHRLAAQALDAMIQAARADGIAAPLLMLVSGYRTAATQAGLWKKALARAGGNATAARQWVAPPGKSAHQSGRAVDLHLGYTVGRKNVAAMKKTAAWQWLVRNAERFGFYPWSMEPWHWEYNPPAKPAESGEVGELTSFSEFPGSVLKTLRSGAEGAAIWLAVRSGFRDESRLTSLVFYARHPERGGRPIQKGEPGFKALSQEWLDIRDRLVRPVLRGAVTPPPEPGSTPVSGDISYPVVPGQEHGTGWGSRIPPGLPATARRASAPGAAGPWIEKLAQAEGLGDVFVRTVRHLAQTESGARFGQPAIKVFDARPPAQRPPGKRLITAWGAFQFNRDAWRSLPGVAKTAFPWDSTPRQEIARPIARYARLYRDVLAAGGSAIDAARGMRLWHKTPAGFRKYVKTGKSSGFGAAWQTVSATRQQVIDKRLRESGVLS